jgi:hypothetical protein
MGWRQGRQIFQRPTVGRMAMQTKYNKQEKVALHAQFDELQRKLVPLWEQIGQTDPGSQFLEEENTLVVLISPQDTTDRPLVHKILERPRLIEQIRDCIPDLNMAHLVPFMTTDLSAIWRSGSVSQCMQRIRGTLPLVPRVAAARFLPRKVSSIHWGPKSCSVKMNWCRPYARCVPKSPRWKR